MIKQRIRNFWFGKLYQRARNFRTLLYEKIIRQRIKKFRYKKLYRKYRDFTMVPYENFVPNLELCERFKEIKGCFVECGVWRGGMSAAIAEVLGSERTYYSLLCYYGIQTIKMRGQRDAYTFLRFTAKNCSCIPSGRNINPGSS
jgi:hypothetical protein